MCQVQTHSIFASPNATTVAFMHCRWVKYHLRRAVWNNTPYRRRCLNFHEDLRDGLNYAVLMTRIAPKESVKVSPMTMPGLTFFGHTRVPCMGGVHGWEATCIDLPLTYQAILTLLKACYLFTAQLFNNCIQTQKKKPTYIVSLFCSRALHFHYTSTRQSRPLPSSCHRRSSAS